MLQNKAFQLHVAKGGGTKATYLKMKQKPTGGSLNGSTSSSSSSSEVNVAAPAATTQHSLLEDGVVVIPFPTQIVDEFNVDEFMKGQVEFIGNPKQKVGGSFGAYGNPSSFHHPQIRKVRHALWLNAIETLKTVHPGQYVCCLPDRFGMRLEGTKPSAETWHRDVSIPYDTLPKNVTVYGGWANLDRYFAPRLERKKMITSTQHFSCVPKSHKNVDVTRGGFAKIADNQIGVLNAKKVLMDIPVYHAIMFNELLAHEIVAQTQTHDSYRLYCKFLVSPEPINVFGAIIPALLDSFGPLPYHIDDKNVAQLSPMYPQLWRANHPKILDDFSKNVRPQFCETVQISKDAKNDEFRGKKVVWVKKFMPSLQEAGFGEAFIPYTEEHRALFSPIRLLPSVVAPAAEIIDLVSDDEEPEVIDLVSEDDDDDSSVGSTATHIAKKRRMF